MNGTDGLVVVDKPSGWTSHQVVGRVRRLLGTRKVGHGGTLDPMATGVLVIGVGRATRLLGHLAGRDKTYLATIRLGQSTVTDDAEGEITDSPGAAGLDTDAIRAAIVPLSGTIKQVPSAVSAIKVDGKRAYARVRAGEDVVLKAREVTVRRFDILEVRHTETDGLPVVDVDVKVDCSTGTYIRALARDLGAALGTGGHLTSLRRTRVGPWTLDDACPIGADVDRVTLRSLDEVVPEAFTTVLVDEDFARDVRHGRRLRVRLDALSAILDQDGTFLALYTPDGDTAVADAVFAPAQGG
ncbi:tRNA pseudouridine(55) synthase TruB [Enemella sp. A6]|uniref:tRNA pseudouridine(55) synthase TruB n=1 Tax=Enemella sp. A6 TaxID=3440152 RepID=UPI003EBD69BE